MLPSSFQASFGYSGSDTVKVLIVSGIFPPDIGGPATFVPEIASALQGRGHQVAVVTLSDRGVGTVADRLFTVMRVPRRTPWPWRQIRTVLQIASAGRSCDLLFINGLPLEATVANMWLRKPSVIKVVGDPVWERARTKGWTVEGFEQFQVGRFGLWIEWVRWLRSRVLGRATRVVVPSRYLARWVAEWGVKRHKIDVVHNSVSTSKSVEPLGVPLQTPLRLVFVGRLVPWKGLDVVITALSRLPTYGLVVVGDGPERAALIQRVHGAGLSDRVWFAGQRVRADALRIMAACHVFVLNSSYEGLPHVALEAMSLGLPVVAAAVGGTPEVIHDSWNGLLVDGSSDGLVEALTRLQDASIRCVLGERGQDTVEESFTSSQMVDKIERVLLNACSESRKLSASRVPP